jgi:chaperonin cofactor prefoldin
VLQLKNEIRGEVEARLAPLERENDFLKQQLSSMQYEINGLRQLVSLAQHGVSAVPDLQAKHGELLARVSANEAWKDRVNERLQEMDVRLQTTAATRTSTFHHVSECCARGARPNTPRP